MRFMHPLRLAILAAATIMYGALAVAIDASFGPLLIAFVATIIPLAVLLYLLPIPSNLEKIRTRSFIIVGWSSAAFLGAVLYRMF